MASDQETRDLIVINARKYVGSQAWSDAVANGDYGPNTNKCNLFVYAVLTESGATPGLPNGFFHHYPPLAGQWADPSYAIKHWPTLASGSDPAPGDVVAQMIPYSDASGHVMIVAPGGLVVGTGDHGDGPHGTIELIPMPAALGPRPTGPKVFRRWNSAA